MVLSNTQYLECDTKGARPTEDVKNSYSQRVVNMSDGIAHPIIGLDRQYRNEINRTEPDLAEQYQTRSN